MSTNKLRVCILHPDLGIGGAERLIVDAALGLQKRGHTVHIYTSYHDPGHAFEETTNGTLTVRYIEPPLPRHIFGSLHILLAILRQIHLVISLLFLVYFGGEKAYDVFLVDQLSACVPLLRWGMQKRVVFYCHFPDKLLADGTVAAVEGVQATKGKGGVKSLVKKLYRLPVNWVEEVTTKQADVILANSNFTSRVFKHSFPSIKTDPVVVYPGINISAYESITSSSDTEEIRMVKSDKTTLLSLNRFERKKNAALAIQAFALLPASDIRLVLAGGYDPRLIDNVECLRGLVKLCEENRLEWDIVSPRELPQLPTPSKTTKTGNGKQVLFILNFSNPQRTHLLTSPTTRALLYTPQNEHFGIVPVEAMVCGVPVVACDSGGPMESVVDPDKRTGGGERTGFLLPSDPNLWARALQTILDFSPDERASIATTARQRVKDMFSLESLTLGMEGALVRAVQMGEVRGAGAGVGTVILGVVLGVVVWMLK
ncbi:glycosyltransferase family 4 protein [Rhizoctonia solani AG-3 Rhs1AP]|uniref:Alpha-1,3/1,6-mannosyltransferase ALG2 n=1 Tax=Rhizoctonia solani AG-3 Rhs1AP TaxID=1086054 RepID=X8JSR6_9AGAM|nr:glycosyltransferase family 4 protein [Rhizoctonia solani AG-3 Rhs1AP]